MKSHRIIYWELWRPGPMTFWVHRPPESKPGVPAYNWKLVDGKAVYETAHLVPPVRPVPGKGWPTFHVEFEGQHFMFTSLAELDKMVEVFSQKHLPTLEKERKEANTGLSSWLTKLPAGVHSWKYREKLVPYLLKVRKAFEKELNSQK